MKTLFIDNGLEEYQLVEGGDLLRFNPKDPNIYARFLECSDKIKIIEVQLAGRANAVDRKAADAGAQTIKIMRESDTKIKEILNQVFGNDNDFDNILRGVNLMAVGSNGKRIIENLIDALIPIMEAGARACVQDEVEKAKTNREERRSHQ